MAFNTGDIFARLSLEYRDFTDGLRDSVKEAKRAGDQIERAFRRGSDGIDGMSHAAQTAKSDFKDLERIVGGIVLSQAFYAGLTAIQDATAAVVGFSNEMEKAQISFQYFLGSAEEASGFIENMKDFAADTSFDTGQAMDLSKKLLNARFEAEEIRDIMETLNDTAAVTGMGPEHIDRIVLAFTQMKTSGKIMGTELRQLAEANIPVYRILQEQLGLTGEQIANIGDLKIPSDIGIAAIFEGLKEFEGAAEEIATTLPGLWENIQDNALMISNKVFAKPYEALVAFSSKIKDVMEEVRGYMSEGGLGAVLEGMVPKELQEPIRIIAGSLQSLGSSFIGLAKAMQPVVAIIGGAIVQALSVLLPVLAGIARAFTYVASAALEMIPGLKYAVAAIGALLIAQVAAKAMLILWSAFRFGAMAIAAAKAIMTLVTALRLLLVALFTNPWTAIATIIAGAFLYIANATGHLSKWLDALMQRLASIGGFDLGSFLQPEDLDTSWMDDYNDSVDGLEDLPGDLTGDFEDGLEDAEKKGKKFKKFLASFDEVFQVPEPEKPLDESGMGLPDMDMPGMDNPYEDMKIPDFPDVIELPEFEWPEIPPFPPIKFPTIQWPKLEFSWMWRPFEMAQIQFRISWANFQAWLEGLALKFPAWGPIPLPNFGPLKDFLRGLLPDIGGILGGVGAGLQSVWQTVWEVMSFPMPQWAEGLIGGIQNLPNVLVPLVGGIGDQLNAAWKTTMEIMSFPMPEWANNTLTVLSTLGPQLLQMIQTAGVGMLEALTTSLTGMGTAVAGWITSTIASFAGAWPVIQSSFKHFGSIIMDIISDTLATMGAFWEEHKVTILIVVGALVAGVIAFFAGVPAAVIGGIVLMGARVLKVFQKLGPSIMTAIRGIPAGFSKVFSKLPAPVRGFVDDTLQFFKDLPGKVWDAIKGIPKLIGDMFKNIKIPDWVSNAAGAVGDFVGGAGKAAASLTGMTGMGMGVSSVTGFASGGIIGNDSIVRLGEKGRKEAVVPLENQTAMSPFADAVAQRMLKYMPQQQRQPDPEPTVYVHTLIADERGLKELERRMRVIRKSEDKRGGGAL